MAFIYIVGLENSLRAGRYGDRILAKTRFSAPVEADPGAHPALCTQGTGLFPESGVSHPPHVAPKLRKE